ncbi:phosphoribosylglycinamide formyltransferase [Orenia marismortui]|uniref:phosphoribosylglycinamide formyltransferase n=1 Tax=Orenia marismortui TaxID=46469 RepID=UPI0003762456|nr:phosphoribosylglycinamide formyltransferase [Orenia marismortui]
MLKIGVLASGRGSNLQSIIDSIEVGELKAEIKVVISDKEGAKALLRADKCDIANKYINPKAYENKSDFEQAMIDLLEENKVDLVVMAGFMRILSPYFVKHYRNRVMNIHPSLLPSFTGLHAQKQALDYGVKVAGCTVHFADEGMDTGPIILQATVPVMDDDTEETLSKRILEEEHRIYPKAIKLFSEGRIEVKDGKVLIINN